MCCVKYIFRLYPVDVATAFVLFIQKIGNPEKLAIRTIADKLLSKVELGLVLSVGVVLHVFLCKRFWSDLLSNLSVDNQKVVNRRNPIECWKFGIPTRTG